VLIVVSERKGFFRLILFLKMMCDFDFVKTGCCGGGAKTI